MNSQYTRAFKLDEVPPPVRDRYGRNSFGQGCLMARRLVEMGVTFVEVSLGGWDNHANIHTILKDQKLPELDQAMSALVEDLAQRSMLEDTAIIRLGEFSRTPRIKGEFGASRSPRTQA